MPIGVGTRVQTSYVPEVTRGTTPATPSMKRLRSITRNINLRKATLASQEVQPHGQVQDLRHGFNSVDGAFNTEWSLNSQDDLLEGIFGSAWATNRLNIGTTLKSYTFERRFEDLALYEVFRGVALNTGEFRLQPESIVGINFVPIGMSSPTPSGVSLGVPAAAPTNQPFDSFTGAIYEGGITSGDVIGLVTSLVFTINRNRTLSPVIGSKFSPDIFEGTCVITGTMTAFFQTHALHNKFVNETNSVIAFDLKDLDAPTTGYRGVMPRVKYTGSNKDPAGTGPVMQELPFQALYDPTEQTSMYLLRGVLP
jgi:hypothetical protein